MRELGVELIYKSQGSEWTYNEVTQLELESRSYSQSTLTYTILCWFPRRVTTKEKMLFWIRNTLQLFEMQNWNSCFGDFVFLWDHLALCILISERVVSCQALSTVTWVLMVVNQNKKKKKKSFMCMNSIVSIETTFTWWLFLLPHCMKQFQFMQSGKFDINPNTGCHKHQSYLGILSCRMCPLLQVIHYHYRKI